MSVARWLLILFAMTIGAGLGVYGQKRLDVQFAHFQSLHDSSVVVAAIVVKHCEDTAGIMFVTRDGVVHDVSAMPKIMLRALTKDLPAESRVEAEAVGDCVPKTSL